MRRPAQYDPNQHPHFYCDDTPGDITGGGTLEQFKRRSWRQGLKVRTPVRRVSPEMARRLYACQFLANKVKQLCPPGMVSGLESHDQIMPLPTETYPDVIPGGNLILGEEYLLGGLSSGVGQRGGGRGAWSPAMARARVAGRSGGRPLNVFQRILMAKKVAKAAECKQVIRAPEPVKPYAKIPFPRGSKPKWPYKSLPPKWWIMKYYPWKFKRTYKRGVPETHVMPSRAEKPPKFIDEKKAYLKDDPTAPPPFIDPIYPPPLIETLAAQHVEPGAPYEYMTFDPALGFSLKKAWRKIRIATKPVRTIIKTVLPAMIPGGIPGGADGELSPEEAYQAQAAADVAAAQGGIPWWVWAGGATIAAVGGIIIIKKARGK